MHVDQTYSSRRYVVQMDFKWIGYFHLAAMNSPSIMKYALLLGGEAA